MYILEVGRAEKEVPIVLEPPARPERRKISPGEKQVQQLLVQFARPGAEAAVVVRVEAVMSLTVGKVNVFGRNKVKHSGHRHL